jgi:hypothetical protein
MLSPVPLNEREVREGAVVRFQFSNVEAGKGESIWEKEYVPGTWVSMKEAAETFPDGGEEGFVAWMKDRCSITSDESIQHHLGVSDVWKKMDSAFIMLGRLVYYEPIMRAFLRKLFATLLEDGVRWVEPRTVFTTPFVLEGQEGPAADPGALSRVLVEEIEAFGKSEEGKGKFWGARFIWTAMRWHDTAAIIDGIFSFPSSSITQTRETNLIKNRHETLYPHQKALSLTNRWVRSCWARRYRADPTFPNPRAPLVPRSLRCRKSRHPVLLPRWGVSRFRGQHRPQPLRRHPLRHTTNRTRLLFVQTPFANIPR